METNPSLTDGLDRLVERAMPILRRAAPGLLGALLRQRCRTSDLVQSALADAVRSFPSFTGRDEGDFVGWTMRIMERNSIDRRRRLLADKRDAGRELPDGEVALAMPARSPSPSQVAIDREALARVARALRQLPFEQRQVLQLVALRGASHAEVAARTGRSEGACRVLLARARAALLVTMARQQDDGARQQDDGSRT
jgi:RNA polymerase sigma-70 factor (ECF subfamily)